MNVSQLVKDQYKKLCRKSWLKCIGNEDILAKKIIRSVELGETIESDENMKVVRYYNLDFLIVHNEVKRMYIESTEAPVRVTEQEKSIYNHQNEIEYDTLSLEDRIEMEEKNISFMNKKLHNLIEKLNRAHDRLDRMKSKLEKKLQEKYAKYV